MLSLKTIKTAINDKLIANFPTIEIQSNDISEGFGRPSFFVKIDNISRDARLYTSERSMTVRIHYFPNNRYKNDIENMETTDKLEGAFSLNFVAGDKTITISDTRAQTVDGVLEFEFDFEFHESNVIEDASDLMQELITDV